MNIGQKLRRILGVLIYVLAAGWGFSLFFRPESGALLSGFCTGF